MEPIHMAGYQQELREQSGAVTEEALREMGTVQSGAMDIEIMGDESQELLGRVAAQLGMSPEDFAARVNPMRDSDYSTVARAAVGRTPGRLAR